MKLALSLNLLALAAAKKLAFLEEQDQAPADTDSCDKYLETKGCDEGWIPKVHDPLRKVAEGCCVQTCEHYSCGEGYTDNQAYFQNIMSEGLDPNAICCDKQCGSDYVCSEGYVLGDPAGPGISSEDCCKPTCVHYDCTGPWTLDDKKKTVVGQSHKECCFPTCRQYEHCERATGWAHWEEKIDSAGETQEDCCLALCSNTDKIKCSDGWFIPKERDDWINGSFHKEDEESACCRKTCKVHTCGAGWAANSSLDSQWGETDEECCVPTCGQFECDWTKGWAKDNVKAAIELHTVEGEENEKCCQPTCKQWQCPNNETWMTPTGNYKENLTKQSNEECCSKACNQHTCTAGTNLVLIPGNKITIGDDDAVCCEPQECGVFRDPRNKTELAAGTMCNSVTVKDDCDMSYHVLEANKNVTLANGTVVVEKEDVVVSCQFDADYRLCRYKVDVTLKGCKFAKAES